MSGIYISGVKMPKEHPLYITLRPDGSVHVWDSYNGDGYGTQAIPVPPHGRLIDADALDDILADQSEDAYNRTHTPRSWERALSAMRDYLEDSPTIIPADPVKEGEG